MPYEKRSMMVSILDEAIKVENGMRETWKEIMSEIGLVEYCIKEKMKTGDEEEIEDLKNSLKRLEKLKEALEEEKEEIGFKLNEMKKMVK